MNANPIRVLIADDHFVVRVGLQGFLASQPDVDVVGEACDGEEAVALAGACRPDVILMDLVMPRKDGLQAIREIKERDPDARILVLTSFSEDERVFQAVRTGALGYLMKDSPPAALLQAIRDVHAGEASIPPALARKLIREMTRADQPAAPAEGEALTARETDVLRLVAQGATNQEIAQALVISEWTVRKHISAILDKLHLSNRTQATLYALKKGLVAL